MIDNKDVRSADYDSLSSIFRPGHADYTYFHKYGIRDPRGGDVLLPAKRLSA